MPQSLGPGTLETTTDSEGNTEFVVHKDPTTVDPTGQPVSSPATSIYNPLTPAPAATGTGTSTGTADGATPISGITVTGTALEETTSSIWINTALPSATTNGVSIQFDYMPESVSFGVTGNFEPRPLPYTSARWLTYQGSDIEEVSLVLKVVAGCNNCITYYSSNSYTSDYSARPPVTAGVFKRNSLIDIAKALYSLPLPANNLFVDGKGKPPPTCRLKVGKMFSGVGAFTRCSIAFNGPYDYDGSPTDMEVSLGFMPSEFYDSSSIFGFNEGLSLKPVSTPTGEDEVAGVRPYALYFGDTQTGQGTVISPTAPATPDAATTPNQGFEASEYPPTATIPADQIQGEQGPTKTTPTNDEVATAMGVSKAEVYYDSSKKTYTIGGTPVTSGGIVVGVAGGTEYSADWMQNKVLDSKVGAAGS